MSTPKKRRRFVRQGDVHLKFIGKEPPKGVELKPHRTNAVAYGEATGSHHDVINGTVYIDDKTGDLYVKTTEDTYLTHLDAAGNTKDHDPIDTLEVGWMKYLPQKENGPEGWVQVVD